MINQVGYEAPHYQIDGPHGLVTTAGSLHRVWEMPPENVKPADMATRSGLFGPWDQSDLGELPPGINPGKIEPVGVVVVPVLPELRHPDLGGGLVQHPPVLADVAQHARLRGRTSTPCRRSRPSERVGREMAAVSFKEYSLQDANTLEATQMGLEAGSSTAGPSTTRRCWSGTSTRSSPSGWTSYQREPAKG